MSSAQACRVAASRPRDTFGTDRCHAGSNETRPPSRGIAGQPARRLPSHGCGAGLPVESHPPTSTGSSPPAPAARGSAEIDPAIAELNRAIHSHPDDKNARLRRSTALAKRRLYQEAIADLDLAIALDPQFF